jgi:hypothetical protein
MHHACPLFLSGVGITGVVNLLSLVIFRTATWVQVVSKLPICSVCVLDRFQSKAKKWEIDRH